MRESTDWNRRQFLHTIPGLGLSMLLPGLDLRAARKRGKERPKSLITVWLAGGPSQLETWDPHPGSPIGGLTKSIKTTWDGVEIADLYPRVAEQFHHVSLIRSLVSKEGDHERGTYFVKTGYRPDPTPGMTHPSLGAILTHELPDASIEIPQHVSLVNSQWPARGGFLGDHFDAFKIPDPGRNVRNLKSHVGDERQGRRLKNLEFLSGSFRRGRVKQVDDTLHQMTIERALTMMSSEQLAAFEIEDVPAARVAAFGDTRFGRGCLVARQLVEQGVRAVEVALPGWDTHANNHEGHVTQAEILDPALSALIADLHERDLFESTVLLVIGEFGRTPKVNPLGGRDHWPTGFSCLVGGGGVRAGVVIGETDPSGEKQEPADPIRVQDLYATILHAVGVPHQRELITPIGRPISLTDAATPIERLLG